MIGHHLLVVRRHSWVVAVALLATATACGGASASTEQDASPSTPPPVSLAEATGTPDDATTTNFPPGTQPPATTAAPATTEATTTTSTLPATVPLPTPAPLPFEDDTPEPVVPLGSIAIPMIGIDRPLFDGIRLPTFDLGPGHWPGTALPGQIGNMVIGGHRTASHADFGDLDLLQPGDEMIVTDNAGASFTYVVDSTEIIDPFAATIIYQTPAKTATLFACHPKGSTDQRIIVRLTMRA